MIIGVDPRPPRTISPGRPGVYRLWHQRQRNFQSSRIRGALRRRDDGIDWVPSFRTQRVLGVCVCSRIVKRALRDIDRSTDGEGGARTPTIVAVPCCGPGHRIAGGRDRAACGWNRTPGIRPRSSYPSRRSLTPPGHARYISRYSRHQSRHRRDSPTAEPSETSEPEAPRGPFRGNDVTSLHRGETVTTGQRTMRAFARTGTRRIGPWIDPHGS